MKKLAIIYFFTFWLFNLIDDYMYWIEHGTIFTFSGLSACVWVAIWFGGTILIWCSNNK